MIANKHTLRQQRADIVVDNVHFVCRFTSVQQECIVVINRKHSQVHIGVGDVVEIIFCDRLVDADRDDHNMRVIEKCVIVDIMPCTSGLSSIDEPIKLLIDRFQLQDKGKNFKTE